LAVILPDPAPRPSRAVDRSWTLEEWCATPGALRHATCEDYRAGASIDLKHDEADADQTVACPTLVLWSKTGLGSSYDVPRVWSERAPRLSAHAVDCGHFLAEERPERTISALLSFMCGSGRPVRAPHRS
jgi:haloacetate dehalogenase